MKELEYENKMVSVEEKETKVVKKGSYVVISPKGNQYSVLSEKLDDFKRNFNVDEHWTIK
jgi:hypothetical protein